MKLFSILALTFLLPLHGGSCFSSMKPAQVIPTNSRQKLLPDDSPMSTLLDLNFKLGERPDLMPSQGSALIDRIKNSNNNLPRYIFFHGPPGCGKSTLIDQFIQAIGADPIYIKHDDLKSQYKNLIPNHSRAIKDSIAVTILAPAQGRAHRKKCSHAVIVLDDVDKFFEDQSRNSNDIFDAFFTPQRLARNILIIGKAKTEKPSSPLVENIVVQYPDKHAALRLAHYFFKELMVENNSFPLNDSILMQNIAEEFSNKPISKLKSFANACITHSNETREKEEKRVQEWWGNLKQLTQLPQESL